MSSLKAVKLFLFINTHEVSTVLCNIIDHQDFCISKVKITIKQALNLIVNNNYFTFNRILYKQNDGASSFRLISLI